MMNKSSLNKETSKRKSRTYELEECSGKEKVDGIGRETEQKTDPSKAKWISCVKKKAKTNGFEKPERPGVLAVSFLS